MPADESIRRFSWRVWTYFDRDDDDPFISDDSLTWANNRRLDRIAAPPACRPIIEEMQATFSDWVADDQPSRWLQLVVLPPGDTNQTVATWANEYDHHIVNPPPREKLLDRSEEFSLPSDSEKSVMVIPRLEDWFLRHQDGMQHAGELLRQASRCERHCVIGCNSWAWQFLQKALGARRLLPAGLTFNAFHSDRLSDWLTDLAEHEDEQGGQHDPVFRLAESGEIAADDYFAKLAARSLGIPWVAWQLWRRSLRLGPNQKNLDQQKFPDERTLWVSEVEVFSLPSLHVDVSLLTLHALLIHGSLSADELDTVTPNVDASNVLPLLMEADLIDETKGRFWCVPAAYPLIRSQLIDAGFPRDEL